MEDNQLQGKEKTERQSLQLRKSTLFTAASIVSEDRRITLRVRSVHVSLYATDTLVTEKLNMRGLCVVGPNTPHHRTSERSCVGLFTVEGDFTGQ